MNPTLVFLHVGPDPILPTLLVRSIRALHAKADIVQCTDLITPSIEGVDRINRYDGDTKNLMFFRLECFAALAHSGPAFYLDTDMLCIRTLSPEMILADNDIAVCRREFNRNDRFNINFRGMDLSEYAGKTLDEIYPFIGCATITKSGEFWADCLKNATGLEKKFHAWYGDQEAIRNIVSLGKYKCKFLPESDYACLPEQRNLYSPRLMHFKGARRKPLMLDQARQMKLL